MKKHIFVTLFLFVLIALLTAQCGGGAAPAQKPAEKPAQQEAAPTSAPAKQGAVPTSAPANQEVVPTSAPAKQEAAVGGSLDGKALLEERCTKCHNLDRVSSKTKTADEWKGTVGRMVGKGANLSEAEQTAVIDYLAKTYGK